MEILTSFILGSAMLSKRRVEIASRIGESVAHHLFHSMLNPEHRGSAFTWGDLEEMAARLASTHVGLAGDFGRDLNTMQCLAEQDARVAIRQCLKVSAVQKWAPLQKSG